MDRAELAHRVLSLVTGIAPDVDAATVIPGIDFRDQFDFDSMDTLNFAIALHRELGVDVPEDGLRATGEPRQVRRVPAAAPRLNPSRRRAAI